MSKVISDKELGNILNKTSIDAMKGWMENPVTKMFMAYITLLKEDNENGVFRALANNELREASSYAAGREEDITILELPSLIIHEIESRKKEKKQQNG